MRERVQYQGPNGEGYFQMINIDLSDIPWDIIDEGVTMFDRSILDQYCERIPECSGEEFKDLIYTRIQILRNNISREIKRTELLLREYGTLVRIQGIGGRQS